MGTVEANASKSAMELAGLREGLQAAIEMATPDTVVTVNFASASAKLSEEAMAALDDAVRAIKARPDACVSVVGHADSRPILSGKYQTNLQLSEARAQAVAGYLAEKGVTNEVMVSGRGHFDTVGIQSSSDGLMSSRRVEVILAEM